MSEWHLVQEELPKNDDYILLSLDNFTVPQVGRYEQYKDGSGAFFLGDETESCVSQFLFVNAWMPLPHRYIRGDENE